MEDSQVNEQKLWNYIDGTCSPEEAALIRDLINNNETWSVKYNQLIKLNALLMDRELEAPSMRFTKNVMEEISRFQVAPATKTYINKNIIRGLTIFFLLMILGLMIYVFGQVHWTTVNSESIIPNFKLDLNKMYLDKIVNNYYINIFIGFNVIVGLFLLDKYLEQLKKNKRRQEWHRGDTA